MTQWGQWARNPSIHCSDPTIRKEFDTEWKTPTVELSFADDPFGGRTSFQKFLQSMRGATALKWRHYTKGDMEMNEKIGNSDSRDKIE
jgi:predicted alpha/beta hydrolase